MFGINKKSLYLDNAATTPVDERVVRAMLPYFSEKFGNASSVHSKGREAKEALDNYAQKIGDESNEEPGAIKSFFKKFLG